MNYNSYPGALPDDIDTPEEFLDYLIFEKQEGYCVYYATAYVLIARSIGIPARYVQGYRVEFKSQGPTIVTENMAHAWPECYLEGIGWIAYEPTPGYYCAEKWKTSSELMAEKENSVSISVEYEAPGEIVLPDVEEIQHEEEEEKKIDLRIPLIILSLTVLVALILYILVLIAGKIRYRFTDDDGKYRISFRRIMKLLRITGYSRKDEETFEEFRKRINAEIPEELTAFLSTYERYVYRDKVIEGSDVEMIEKACRDLYSHAKSSKTAGRLSLLFYRVLPG